MSEITNEVKQKLTGFELRQAERDALRDVMRRLKIAQKARREGRMATFDQAIETLREMDTCWVVGEDYGIRTIMTGFGMFLAFDRTGKLSWNQRPSREEGEMRQLQLSFESESPGSQPRA